jgi:hypothetical protein
MRDLWPKAKTAPLSATIRNHHHNMGRDPSFLGNA